jgi:hypothetical protein
VSPPLHAFDPRNLVNGYARPTDQTNAWSAALDDRAPTLTLSWPDPVTLGSIEIGFDTDFDHPLETVLMLNPETIAPTCVPAVRVTDEAGRLVGEIVDNHLSTVTLRFAQTVHTRQLTLTLTPPASGAPAALFAVRCYAPEI